MGDDFDISYLNNNNNNNINMEKKTNENPKKPNFTTETDFHLNYLANPDKIRLDMNNEIPKVSDDDDDDNSSSNKSNPHVNILKSNNSVKKSPKINSYTKDDKYSPPSKKIFSEKELRFKKIELLRRLSEIKASGYELSKDYDFNSDIEEMEYEYELLKSMKDKQNGVGLYKSFLLNACTAIEFLNDRYDPFDFKLSGWSEHMNIAVDDYNDVLGEIYEKYRGSGKKMEPEIKLMLMICASGASFHASNTMFKQLPGLEKLIKENPALLSKLTSQMFNDKDKDSNFMTRQEINAQEQMRQQQIRQQQLKAEQMEKQNELRQQQLLRQQMMERQRQEEVLAAQGFPNSVPAPVMQVNAPLNNKIAPQQLNHIEQQRQQQINNLNEPQVTGPSNVDNI